MFMDLELSRRIERTEGMIGTTYSAPRNSVADVGACTRDFEGTIAVFDGADSPLTQTFGLGMSRPVDDDLLTAIEAFFTERGAPTHHVVSPFAGVETSARLVGRGYTPVELSTVLVQAIAGAREPATTSTLRARVIDPVAEGAAWIETCVAGWATDEGTAKFMHTIASVNIANHAMTHYLVEDGGTPVATGSMGVVDGVALLAGASTVPAARGRGAQALLLATRLHDARARGCDVAMMVAGVGTQSQRNAERNGFRVAYTRTKWQLVSSRPEAEGTR